jgi:hypothetical protein
MPPPAAAQPVPSFRGKFGPQLARLWAAQGGCCFHCGRPMAATRRGGNFQARWSREHLYPKSTTGRDVRNNVVLAHRGCNAARGNREPTEDEIIRAGAIFAAIGQTAFLRFRDRPAAPPLGTLAAIWPASIGSVPR